MGCICSKRRTSNQYVAENHVKDEESNASRSFKQLSTSSGSEKVAIEPDVIINDTTARLMSNPSQNGTSGSTPISWDEGEMNEEITVKMQVQMSSKGIGSVEQGQPRVPRIGSISGGERGAQILAGWPSWLTSVAGEAISGWIPRRAESFEKLEKIGQGTYSSVYRARDRETNKFVALKKVRFANMDPESVRFMAREILVLRRLDHPNVMKLEGIISSRVSGSLYLIFEYMEHDLVGLAALPGTKLNEPQIKCYMQQLLRGLDHCHKHGVLHRDIKGSNLLVDNNGNLKIGDFGLATFFQPSQRQPLTSRVVTLWYRPPELLLGATDYGVAADLWSSGCVLAELFAGKPIMPGRTEVEQLHKIFKLCGSPSEEYWKKSKLPHATIFKPTRPYKRIVAETFKDLPSSALSLLEVLLAVEPENRGTASLALESEFFTTEPLPCDPSTMPKYPPSKEFDAKRRGEDARRRSAVANKGHEQVSVWRDCRESRVVPAPEFNAELQVSIQKRKERPDLKCISDKYNPEEDVYSHSGQVVHPTTNGSSRNVNLEEALKPAEWRKQRSCMHDSATLLTRFSNSVVVRGSSRFGIGGDSGMNSQWTEDRFGHNQYSHLADGQTNQLVAGPNTSHKKASPPLRKELMGYASRKGRIHYSGPLLPPGGDVEEMLKEHERQIQQAVRKARVDKVKTKKGDSENGQTESLSHNVRNDK